MKIFFYINTLSGGGAERVIANLASQFSKYGDEVGIVCSFAKPNEYEVHSNVKRYVLEQPNCQNFFLIRNIRRVRLLRKIIKQECPDVLISFMAEPNYRALIATMGLRTKNIISVRNDPKREYGGAHGKLLAKWLLPLTDGCVFQTEEAKLWFPKRLQKKSRIIFNAVKPAFYGVKWEPGEGKRIVTFGRLSEQKNHPLLIEAFTTIANEYPDTMLFIYGEGALRNELQQQIQENGMAERIQLCGNTTEVAAELSRSYIFVLSSDYEGMPNALMEAMTVGVPCISTDCPCGGPKSLIVNGENGLLIPVGDVQALTQAMRRLLDDQKYAKNISSNAKKSSNRFHPDLVFDEWCNYVEVILHKDNAGK